MFWRLRELWLENREGIKAHTPWIVAGALAIVLLIMAFESLFAKIAIVLILLAIGSFSAVSHIWFGPILDLITFVTVLATYMTGFWGALVVGVGSVIVSRTIRDEMNIKTVPYVIAIAAIALMSSLLVSADIRIVGVVAFIVHTVIVLFLFTMTGTPPVFIGVALLINALFNILLFLRLAPYVIRVIA